MILVKHFMDQLLYVIKTSKKGFVSLLSVMIISAIGLSIATALLFLGTTTSQNSLLLQQSAEAKSFANACGEEALQQIYTDNAYSGSGSLTFAEGSCNYAVTNPGSQSPSISTQGSVGEIIRQVQITVGDLTPQLTISSWQEI